LEGGGAGGEGEIAVQEACHLDGAWIVGSKIMLFERPHGMAVFFQFVCIEAVGLKSCCMCT
jgi:hypothetical protein